MAGSMKLVAVVVGLLFLVPDTMQLPIHHPIHVVVERIKVSGTSYLGLVISTTADEALFIDSPYYEPDADTPDVIYAGRKFNLGTFKSEKVIHVLGGKPLANVAATVQMMIDLFPIKGIINYGSVGTVSNQVIIADVVIPSQVAFTGVWNWEEYESEVDYPSMKIGDYNVPEAGKNKLAHLTFLQSQEYVPTDVSQKTYFFDIHPEWVKLASRINFGERPTVHLGESYRVGSSDIYVSNSAFGSFLNKNLNITIVDTSSAAVVATSIANGLPHIVIKGASNRPGTEYDARLSETTKKNVLKTVETFIGGLSESGLKAYA